MNKPNDPVDKDNKTTTPLRHEAVEPWNAKHWVFLDWIKALPFQNFIILGIMIGTVLATMYAINIRSFSADDPGAAGNLVLMFAVVGILLAVVVSIGIYFPAVMAFWFAKIHKADRQSSNEQGKDQKSLESPGRLKAALIKFGFFKTRDNQEKDHETQTAHSEFKVEPIELVLLSIPLMALIMALSTSGTDSFVSYAMWGILAATTAMLTKLFWRHPSWIRFFYYWISALSSVIPGVILLNFTNPQNSIWLASLTILGLLALGAGFGATILNLGEKSNWTRYTLLAASGLVLTTIFVFPILSGKPNWFPNQCAVLIGIAEAKPVEIALKPEGYKALKAILRDSLPTKPCTEKPYVEGDPQIICARPVLKGEKVWQLEIESSKDVLSYASISADQIVSSAHRVPNSKQR